MAKDKKSVGLHVVSQSADGRKRQIIVVSELEGGKKATHTKHQVLKSGEWVSR